MKKVKDSQKRWKQLVTMLLVAALLVTGTPDVVGFASEGTQEQVTAAAEQSQKTQEKAQKESAQEETAQKEAVQDHEQMSEEAGGQQSSSSHSDTAVKEENTEKERSAAGTTERSETEEPQKYMIIQPNIEKEQQTPKIQCFRGFLYILKIYQTPSKHTKMFR